MENQKITKRYYGLFIILFLLYIVISLSVKPDPVALAKFGITALHSRLITISFFFPILIIWLSSFYGFIKFRTYAEGIKNDIDGRAFLDISQGLGVLAIGLPIAGVLSSLANYVISTDPSFIPALTIFNNYLGVLIPLTAFIFMYRGAKMLGGITNITVSRFSKILTTSLFVIFSAAYIYFSLINPIRQFPDASLGGRATYYLPDWLIVLTIIIPYLYIWYNGLRVAFTINAYSNNISGFIYKKAFKSLSQGIAAVIGSYICINFLSAFGSLFAGLGLGSIIVIIYALLVVIAVGYIYIALGAKRLGKIEEVI